MAVQTGLNIGFLAVLDTAAHASAAAHQALPLQLLADGVVTGTTFVGLIEAADQVARRVENPFQKAKLYFLATMITLGVHSQFQNADSHRGNKAPPSVKTTSVAPALEYSR